MWHDSDLVVTRETEPPTARHSTGAIRQDYPEQEIVDYYIAKASAMRSRSFRRVFVRGWGAMRR